MKHLLDIIQDKGYKPFGYGCTFKDQNADSKHQVKMFFKRDDIFFIDGDRQSEISSFYYPKNKDEISTMIVGGIAVYWVKDLDFKKGELNIYGFRLKL